MRDLKRFIFLGIFILLLSPFTGEASSLSVSPTSGTFSVGSTFDVSLVLDTKGKSINAIQAFLTFPPDKLQVVSPSTGQSIIGVWTAPPKFSNTLGTIELEGGIPGGIIASNGILTKITFRVKSVGEAIIKFSDRSKVFLDDGLATDDLSRVSNAVFQLRLPPPQGPIVASESHPDQTVWYPSSTAILRFAAEATGVEGYSFVLNNDPTTVPDNISEGTKNSVVYSNLTGGTHYFHIRSLRDGVWGGTTHFVVNVDATPPADFPIEILPSARMTSTKPVIQFNTTDANSGLDRFEVKIIPLSGTALEESPSGGNFFIEAESPYISSPLPLGSYDVIVRAYDHAGNHTEVTKRFVITTPLFKWIGSEGLQVKNIVLLSWFWVFIIGLILLIGLGYGAYQVWVWRHSLHHVKLENKLPDNVQKQLEELQAYREKYGAVAKVLLAIIFTGLSLMVFNPVSAQTLEITPPLITTVSKDISNKEIFYAGGKTDVTDDTVILYLQNLFSGETVSHTIQSDQNGDWFYRHDGFLSPGNYILWTQSRRGEQLSPPSSTTEMTVRRTALEFGANRLSYETIYLFAIIVLLLGIAGLVFFIMYHFHHGKKRRDELAKEVAEAEESIRRGFALLRRDVEAQLAVVRKANLSAELSLEEKEREAQLLHDLNVIQKKIGKEVWDIKTDSW